LAKMTVTWESNLIGGEKESSEKEQKREPRQSSKAPSISSKKKLPKAYPRRNVDMVLSERPEELRKERDNHEARIPESGKKRYSRGGRHHNARPTITMRESLQRPFSWGVRTTV